MRKSDNYFVLAFGVCFLIMACIQIRLDGLLPAWVFFAIAFVSINLNVYSIFKNLWHYFQDVLNKKYEEILQISNKGSYCDSEKEKFALQRYEKRKKQWDKVFGALNLIFDISVIISTVIIILLSSIKKIPYDFKTNKIISVATLISFSLSFLALFIASRITSRKD